MNFDELNNLHDEVRPNTMQATWLISLADLISLVLTFFILMYSTRDLPQDKLNAIQTSFVEYMEKDSPYKFIYKKQEGKTIREAAGVNYVEGVIKNSLLGNQNLNMTTHTEPNQVVIEFFSDQQSIENFSGSFKDQILLLTKTLNSLTNQIEVRVLGEEPSLSMHLAQEISRRIVESGYEYNILQTVNDENTENLEKDKNNLKIQILVKGYEFAF